jgi:hypothetical protein
MDASTYLRRKVEAMPKVIHRDLFQDAGFRTEMLGHSAAVFKPVVPPTPILPCCTSSVASGGSFVEAVKPTTCCVSRDYMYTTPYVTEGCCPIPYMSTSYLSPCTVPCFQATPAQQAAAATRMVNRSNADCCS